MYWKKRITSHDDLTHNKCVWEAWATDLPTEFGPRLEETSYDLSLYMYHRLNPHSNSVWMDTKTSSTLLSLNVNTCFCTEYTDYAQGKCFPVNVTSRNNLAIRPVVIGLIDKCYWFSPKLNKIKLNPFPQNILYCAVINLWKYNTIGIQLNISSRLDVERERERERGGEREREGEREAPQFLI